ncbi:MAG: hypothetical protein WCE44_11940 [Candidatus Velthaea sp.]|jgi:predicted GH43/DUF377 family glycosyl hydrolase
MTVTALPRFDATLTRLGVVLAPDGSPAEIEGVLNPAATRDRDGRLVLYPRCVAAGNVSRIGRAIGQAIGDVETFTRDGFALEPTAEYEIRPPTRGGMGCEDARVTFVPVLDRYLMAYCAFGPLGPRIAIAVSPDAHTWERLGLADFSAPGLPAGDDKDGAFFPEPVYSPAGVLSIAFYHRPMLHISTVDGRSAIPTILAMAPSERESTRIAYVPLEAVLRDVRNVLQVAESALVLSPEGPWGRIKTGGGTPPVRIEEGWLSMFHGVDAIDVDGRYFTSYSAGFVVHDLHRPHHVRYRSHAPVLIPEGREELHGVVNNVVFPTAIDVIGERRYDVFYGMADARIGRVRLELAPASSAADETAA